MTREDRWSCPNCREIIEDQFDSCWQCGCSRDGELNLEFLREPATSGDLSALEKAFMEAFVCAKCDCRDARVERVGARGTGFAKLSAKDFLAVSCSRTHLSP